MTEFILYAGALIGLLATLATLARALGGDRWKSEYEAAMVEVGRLEKLVAAQDTEIKSLQTRIASLETTLANVGSSNVYEAVRKVDADTAERTQAALAAITTMFDNYERRAEERHEKLLGLFETLGHSFADLATQISERNST